MKKLTLSLMAGVAAAALGASAAQAEIPIATAGPMTGQYATFGEQMRNGAELAVADINAEGGVLGEQLTLSVGDDACDPRQAVSVANEFVNEGVIFVAGHFCSGSSIPASQVYTEEAILLAKLAAGLDTYTNLAGDIESKCDKLSRNIESNWEDRALSEVTTAGYYPTRKHGVAINIHPLVDAEIVPDIVEERVI